ncbi:rhamnulokinase [Candidatus Bipolaricaulota bacterium]|nr:rhamnulokinase [Candidatus Bipolaricaulota bacterium]
MSSSKVIAIDLGANSGRAIAARFTGGEVKVEELHRFSNGPVSVHGRLYWDVLRMFEEIKESLRKYASKYDDDPISLGIDSWGVDYGLFDKNGRLLRNPVHYRDSRTDGAMDEAFEVVSKEKIFEETGIQFMELNTLYQLFAQKKENPESLKSADSFLMMSDIFNYFLTGEMTTEFSLATTSQLYDPVEKEWAKKLFADFGFPLDMMQDVVKPGTRIGRLTEEVAEDVGLESVPVVAPATHDTASAVAAIPAKGDDWAFISSGTWSLMGKEIEDPVINDDVLEANFTNEGGVAGTYRFLRNLTGLWIIQECKREWEKEGKEYSYEELTDMARAAKPFVSFLDTDHESFLSPGDMPEKIRYFCERTGQTKPEDKGQIVRVVLESLALNYRYIIEILESLLDENIETVHIVGGGVRNQLLSQFSANAMNREVVTRPAEATAIGNALIQALEIGEIDSLEEGRRLVRGSIELETYTPEGPEGWKKPYEEFLQYKEL